LLDEIEKAHPDVFNMLLQVMEEGRLTDSFGRNVDFRNTILIMTTNAGADAIKNEASFGFQAPDNDASYESMKVRVLEQIERVFRPEFLNRLDETIIFRHLDINDLKQVIDLELAKVRERLADMNIALELTDDAKEYLVNAGSNTDYGARPLRRAIESRIEDPLSEELLKGEFEGKNKIVVDAIWDDDHERITRLDFQGTFFEKIVANNDEDSGDTEAVATKPKRKTKAKAKAKVKPKAKPKAKPKSAPE
jgi:ATP-dependent Clp protease ATP-binding subunit ClpC